ncbi:MAG TPA: PAS domain S-box protein, partial [Bryobacteraceae bacterium]|nr:PAS domain S-box protein [Bryobacteraceae bacterium]
MLAVAALPVYAADEPTLTRISDIRKLPAAEAQKGFPVRVRAVLTHYNPERDDCFIQDSTGGIWVAAGTTPRPMRAGELVEVRGRTDKGAFAPLIRDPDFRVLGQGRMPAPHPLPYPDLSSAVWDSQWVELRGRVRNASIEGGRLLLWLGSDGHRYPIALPLAAGTPEQFVGARVRARGVCATVMNLHSQTIGFQLHVPTPEFLKVEEAAPRDPWVEPVASLSDMLRFFGVADTRKWVHVRGVVTMQIPGHNVFILSENTGLRVQTPQTAPALEPGDVVEVLGFPALGETAPFLEDSIYRKVGRTRPPEGEHITAQQAIDREADDLLVEINARLLSQMVTGRRHTMAFRSGDVLFFAEVHDDSSGAGLAGLPEGTLVRITGLCQIRQDQNTRPLRTFHLLLRSAHDIQVLEQPPWLNARRAVLALGIMGALILAAAAWAAVLRRRVQAQTALIVRKLEAEASLEKRYRDLVENANDMIYTRDLKGNLTALNPAGERITGYSREEALTMNLLDLAAPEEREPFRARMELTHSYASTVPFETRIRCKDGQLRTLEFSPHLISEDGRPVRVEGIARDVTERRRVQAQFKAAKEMAEAANRAKSEFLANMSHEIRTPMNGVIGMSELVLETDLTPEQREYIDTIRTCAESLLGVINDILDFSKIEAHKLELDDVEFDVRKLLDGVARSMRVRVEQKGLELRVEASADVPERLRGDPDRLRQVLVNLM